MSPIRTVTAAALCIMIGTACGSKSASPDVHPDDLVGSGRQGTPDVRVTVENQNFYDATIYAVMGARRRLGTVNGNSASTFTFPWRSGDVYFVVDFIGGPRGYQTTRLNTEPGDHLELTLTPNSHRLIGR